jgi:cobalt-zinc-cadmium efflux system membrane fusion protein
MDRFGIISSLRGRMGWFVVLPDGSGQRSGATRSPRQWGRTLIMSRFTLLILVAVVSALIGSWFPRLSAPFRGIVAPLTGAKNEAQTEQVAKKGGEGVVRLTPEQIAAAHIQTARVKGGALTRRIDVPAAVKPDPDHIGRVAAKVAGTVAEMRKRLGDNVVKDEVIAVIDSREVADAKSEYLAALANYKLQEAIFQREKGLFDKKIIAEQLFLRTKTTFTQARLRLDLARQKLASLDVSDAEVEALPSQPVAALRRKEIRAPISGRVIERLVNLGQPVGGSGQSTELYVLADLSVVEADLAVPIADLGSIREKQRVRLTSSGGRKFDGEVIFVNAMITPETRTGHVIASFPNADFSLHPGSLLNAEIDLERTPVKVRVPRSALQLIDGDRAVFVRTPEGFVERKVEIGKGDDDSVEILSGVAPGDEIAVSNTFVLKAELGKHNIPEE